jgi:hypothetical protein
MWLLQRGVILTKDNLDEIETGAKCVLSALRMKQLKTTFLIVYMLNFSREWFILY